MHTNSIMSLGSEAFNFLHFFLICIFWVFYSIQKYKWRHMWAMFDINLQQQMTVLICVWVYVWLCMSRYGFTYSMWEIDSIVQELFMLRAPPISPVQLEEGSSC